MYVHVALPDTQATREAISEGMAQGLELATKHLTYRVESLDYESDFDDVAESLQTVIAGHDEVPSPRFVRLVAQLVAVALVTRLAFDEPPLTEEEIAQHVCHALAFLGRWANEV